MTFKKWFDDMEIRYQASYSSYEELLQEAFEAGANQEREACADLVENFEYQDKTGRHDVFFLLPHEHVAKAIRARGKA
jgi:hypothetical protein